MTDKFACLHCKNEFKITELTPIWNLADPDSLTYTCSACKAKEMPDLIQIDSHKHVIGKHRITREPIYRNPDSVPAVARPNIDQRKDVNEN